MAGLYYKTRGTLPKGYNTMSKKALYTSVYNEMFLNAQSPVFDRYRIYGGFGYVINKNFRVETGLMAQIQENTRP